MPTLRCRAPQLQELPYPRWSSELLLVAGAAPIADMPVWLKTGAQTHRFVETGQSTIRCYSPDTSLATIGSVLGAPGPGGGQGDHAHRARRRGQGLPLELRAAYDTQPMLIYRADLGHNQLTVSPDIYPLGVANLAAYLTASLQRACDLRIRPSREPEDLNTGLTEEAPEILAFSNYTSKIEVFGEHPSQLGKFTRTMFAHDLPRVVRTGEGGPL